MEKVQESDGNNLSTNATPEPVSQNALSECLAYSDLLPSQRQSMHTLLQENRRLALAPSCSALLDTGSPVNLLSEKIQRQLNLAATPLESHYKLLGATGETLTTLGTVQVDILLGRKVWTTTAIVVSSLTHHLILGLDFLKLTKSKVDFETNTVETGSTLYLANIHCMQRSNSTIIIPKSDVYRLCQSLHPTLNVTSSLPLASKTSPLFNLNVTLLGKNY